MIKINKFENIFGIKKLIGANNLGRLNVIYAPNGTAKSSIADALENISNQEGVDDVYGSGTIPTFEIDVDGCVCDENNYVPFNIIKYCGVEDFELVSGEEYKGLVLSPSLSSKVSVIQTSINNSIKNISNILQACFKKKGKGKGEPFSKYLKEAISIVSNKTDDDALVVNFILNLQTSLKPLSSIIDEDTFFALANIKAVEVANKPSVKQNLNEYARIVKKKVVSNILDGSFVLDNLIAFLGHAKEDNYFDTNGKRKLLINNEEYGLTKFEETVKHESDLIYGDDEVKQKIDSCRDELKKNKATTSFANVILNNPELLAHASDYSTFINELFVTFLGDAYVKQIEIEKSNILAEQSKLASMKNAFVDGDSKIDEIWQKYKARFFFEKFDLEIKNRFDASIGFEVPKFVKFIKGTKIEITDAKALRFSTGEIRSFNLINAIITIEKERLSNNHFTIILDDAVDSFDYKNKYGIIDYLLEIKDDSNIQMVVLTHNFDFYRTMILAFGKTNTNQYFMYKNQNDVVEMYDTKNKGYYLEIVDFNNWKNCTNSAIKYFAYVPFARNIIQLKTGSSNQDVKDIDKYLHYDLSNSETKDFADLDRVINSHTNYALPYSVINISDKYIKKLNDVTISLLYSQVNETDLENKIAIGLYIRIFLERFLSKRYLSETGTNPTINNPRNSFLELKNQAYPYLSNIEKAIIMEANVIAPSYVHANSFMYEPLIDVGTTSLINIARKIKLLNDAWPL